MRICKLCATASVIGFTSSLMANPPFQQQVSFTAGASGTWNVDWSGESGRTYFIKWSLDLVTWHYAPFVKYGQGVQTAGIQTVGAQKLFIRLHYAYDTTVTTLQQARDADFDNDGIPNYYEIETLGSDPLDKGSAGGDGDSDGMVNGWEIYYFGNLTTANPNAVLQPDGLNNKEKSELGLSPNVNYSDPTAVQKSQYTHNNAGRLMGVTAAVGTASFTPDEEGNITNAH
jgi:hypothetical protein